MVVLAHRLAEEKEIALLWTFVLAFGALVVTLLLGRWLVFNVICWYFHHFLIKHDLHRLHLSHPTYHHFVGNGLFDSDLDVVLYSNIPGASEKLSNIICKFFHSLSSSGKGIIELID